MRCPSRLPGRWHTNRTITQELLNTLDGVTLTVEEFADAMEQCNVFRAVIPPAAATLQRANLAELGFPETEDVRRNIEIFRYLTDRSESRRRLTVAPNIDS